MKLIALHHLLLVAIVSLSSSLVRADDAKPLLVKPGKVVAQPDFKSPLAPEWTIKHGKWDIAEGEMSIAELPENKHAAVLWHSAALASAVIECEFQWDGAKAFLVGCDGAKHIGRMVITAKNAKLCEDSTEVKGKVPSHTLAEAAVDLKPGEWHKLRLEWTGDRMAVRLDGAELNARHPYLATPKARWWFAVGGAKLKLRNVKACEGVE